MMRVPNQYRVRCGLLASSDDDGDNSAFCVPCNGRTLFVIASDGEGWEHVSVSLKTRCPMWVEMEFIKNLFWDPEDVVIQIHPARTEYVNTCPYCLHLWRKAGTNDYLQRPDKRLVGG